MLREFCAREMAGCGYDQVAPESVGPVEKVPASVPECLRRVLDRFNESNLPITSSWTGPITLSLRVLNTTSKLSGSNGAFRFENLAAVS